MSDFGYGVVGVAMGIVVICGIAFAQSTMAAKWFELLARGLEGFFYGLFEAIRGLTGERINLMDFVGHSYRSHPPDSQPKPIEHQIAFRGFERFEANTDCPTCGAIAVHRMREPRIASKYKQRLMTIELGVHHAKRYNELVYEVIRICAQCGQEWGQR